MSDFLYTQIPNVRDPNQLIHWDELTVNNQNTLKRILQVAFDETDRHKSGFTYNDIRVLSISHVKDARSTGAKRLEDLVAALQTIFSTNEDSLQNPLTPRNSLFGDIPNNRPYGSIIPWTYLNSSDAMTLENLFKAKPFEISAYNHGFTFEQISNISRSVASRARGVGQQKLSRLRIGLTRVFQDPEPIPKSGYEKLTDSKDVESSILFLEQTLIEMGIQSQRNIEIAKSRMAVFLTDIQTLDSVGAKYGLTRERARQIQVEVEKLRVILPNQHHVLLTAKKLITNSQNVLDFQRKIFDHKLTQSVCLNPNWFVAFAQILGDNELEEFFKTQVERLSFASKEISIFSSGISKYRSKMGVVDVHKVAVETGQPYQIIQNAVLNKYRRCILDQNLILAGTALRLTMFEAVLVKQFLVNPFLTVSDLREGIERQAGYRGMDLDSPHDDYEGLITKVAGDPPSFEKIKSNLKNDIKLSNHEQWLVDLFNSSETGMLHRDSITESALSRGISLGSLAIYLSYLPIVRTAGPAVYCLVGTKFTEKALLGIREGAKDSAKQTEIAFQVVGSTISFEIKPNIGTISSGVVFPPKELVNLIRSHSFTSTCVCQELESEQIIKVSKDGFWVGFSAIFRHAYRDHKIPDESKLLIKFDLKRNTANIYGNTM